MEACCRVDAVKLWCYDVGRLAVESIARYARKCRYFRIWRGGYVREEKEEKETERSAKAASIYRKKTITRV